MTSQHRNHYNPTEKYGTLKQSYHGIQQQDFIFLNLRLLVELFSTQVQVCSSKNPFLQIPLFMVDCKTCKTRVSICKASTPQ